MVLFEWGPEFCVGVREIDEQHRRIVELINELHDAMLAGKAESMLERVFAETISYATTHLAWEEELMRRHAYPDLPAQELDHARFKERVRSLQARFAAGEERLSLTAVMFLVDWLAEHIQGLDAKLGKFLNEKGIR